MSRQGKVVCPVRGGPISISELIPKEEWRKRQPEEIIGNLREAEIVLAQDGTAQLPAGRVPEGKNQCCSETAWCAAQCEANLSQP